MDPVLIDDLYVTSMSSVPIGLMKKTVSKKIIVMSLINLKDIDIMYQFVNRQHKISLHTRKYNEGKKWLLFFSTRIGSNS